MKIWHLFSLFSGVLTVDTLFLMRDIIGGPLEQPRREAYHGNWCDMKGGAKMKAPYVYAAPIEGNRSDVFVVEFQDSV